VDSCKSRINWVYSSVLVLCIITAMLGMEATAAKEEVKQTKCEVEKIQKELDAAKKEIEELRKELDKLKKLIGGNNG